LNGPGTFVEIIFKNVQHVPFLSEQFLTNVTGPFRIILSSGSSGDLQSVLAKFKLTIVSK